MPNDGYCEIADLGGCWKRAHLQARRHTRVRPHRRPRRLRPAVPHYFFSQFDNKMSTFTGRLAATFFRKEAPLRTQQGMHIVLKKFYPVAKEFHLAIFQVEHGESARARVYAAYIRDDEAARKSGESPPPDTIPAGLVEACIVQNVIVSRAIAQRLVAHVAANEIPLGYFNGCRDFLSESTTPSSIPAEESESEEELDSHLQNLQGQAIANMQVMYERKLVTIASGRFKVYDDGSVYAINQEDESAY